MTGEEIGREQKAKRIVRAMLAALIVEAKDPVNTWADLCEIAKVQSPSPETRKRVVEILEGIAI